MSRPTIVLLCTCVLAPAAVLDGQPAVAPLDRPLESDVVVQLPVTGRRLVAVLRRMAELVRAPIGIELLPQPVLPERVVAREPSVTEVREIQATRLRNALDAIFALTDQYEWWDADGVINVAPRALAGSSRGFLNRRVAAFAIEQATIGDAIDAVHRLFDSDYRSGGVAGSLPHDPAADPTVEFTRRQRVMARRGSLHMTNVTVREILNALARSYGLSWEVDYRGPSPSYENSRIGVRVLDGFNITSTPRSVR